MPTVTFTNASGTLTASGRPFDVYDYGDLIRVAGSVGRNLAVSGADGTLARRRRRGELPVDLGIEIYGDVTPAGAPPTVTGDLQARRNLRHLLDFLDADRGGLSIDLDDHGDTYEADEAQYEDHAGVEWHGGIVKLRVLLVVNAGKLTFVEGS